MKKRILSLALALVMVLITIVIPSSVTVSARGNGYSPISFKYNGKDYSGHLTTHYNPTEGGWSSFYTLASIRVDLDGPVVKYDTINYGKLTCVGKYVSQILTAGTTTVRTEAVPCTVGMERVIKCESIYAYVAIYADGGRLSTSTTGNPA